MHKAAESRNKAALQTFVDATNSGDAERIATTVDEVFSPDLQFSPPLPLEVTGTAAVKEVFSTLLRAYPDLHIAVDDLIEEGDKVVALQTVTGTHLGEFMGLPPTGRSVAYEEVFIFRYADGRIAETWGIVDVPAVMRQLGVTP